jgi:hypothetical protein
MNHAFTGALTGTAETNTTQTLNVTFQGNTANEFANVQTVSYTAPFVFSQTVNSKSYLRQEGNEIVNFGNTSESTTPIMLTSTTVYDPPYREKKYTLSPGESITQTQTQTTTSVLNGAPQPPVTSSNTTSTKYVGMESVTVPAGTFNSCRFEVTQVSGPQAGQLIITTWEIVGKTVTAKTVSPDSQGGTVTMSLTSATVNGSPVN